jgi:hypothetical protein
VYPLRLADAEREVALDEARAVLALTEDGQKRADLALLADALTAGEVGEAHAALLERIICLGLQTGRIRALYGPTGEQAALRLHRRLPEGAEGQERAREVTDALTTLRGRELESIQITAHGPGAFTVAVSAGGVEFSVRLDRQGARLTSVGV